MGLAEHADARSGELAYGDKRRLEIGLALATEPQLLLLDEPAAGMSPNETSDTVALIRQLRTSLTIVIVEHDMDVVFGLADRIIVMQNGATIANGTPAEIRANERVREAYLRPGPTSETARGRRNQYVLRRIARALRRLAARRRRRGRRAAGPQRLGQDDDDEHDHGCLGAALR